MTPRAVCRWAILHTGEKITATRYQHVYLTEEGVVVEDKDGETAPTLHPWDDVARVILEALAGSEAEALAKELEAS